jgi:hypothetical protein
VALVAEDGGDALGWADYSVDLLQKISVIFVDLTPQTNDADLGTSCPCFTQFSRIWRAKEKNLLESVVDPAVEALGRLLHGQTIKRCINMVRLAGGQYLNRETGIPGQVS